MKPAKPPDTEPAHDILHHRQHPLDVFFAPQTVAVMGATETPESVGRTLLWNLLSNPFGGTVFPVNLKRASVLGIKAYPKVSAIPDQVELAVVATPARTVPGILGECQDAGVKGAIVISAGFKETGEAGARLEQELLAQARRGRMRVIGPNCLGLMNPFTGFNATFAGAMALPGSVAFISQSGALATAILDWSLREAVGFSAFVSIGSMVDVGWGDLIDYFGDDARTRSIVLYMESVGDARAFLSASRAVAQTKPIIVIKAGRTEAAAKAAASHTGALTGSDEVLDAAFRRSGVLRVNTIEDLFSMAAVLAKQPRPKGPRLAILTNAGGPGVLAADELMAQGGQLAKLSSQTVAGLDHLLPPHWSHGNPIDILGDAGADRYAKSVEIVSKDSESDGLLVILAPQGMTEPVQIAQQLKSYAKLEDRPILASWMGGGAVEPGRTLLNRAGIPTFAYPDAAARMFNDMARYSYNLQGLQETPTLAGELNEGAGGRGRAKEILDAAREAGRTLLTEFESKQLLAAYGIPAVETRLAASEAEAMRWASEIGYPVVLKLHSQTVTHKTDVGGVQLDLGESAAVRNAFRTIASNARTQAGPASFLGVTVQPMVKLKGYEIILGSALDAQFGPVLLFGSGGALVEVFQDRALALPPLNTTLARRMMEQTRIYAALKGVRGRKPVDLAALEELLVRFSQLVVEQRWIKEIDINPLLVSEQKSIALDARVVLHGPEVRREQLPRLAIRPYPARYTAAWKLKDGRRVTIRPIRPEDEPWMVKFHQTLSERSVYMRYFQPLGLSQRVAHERLTRICYIDYDREMALVADAADSVKGRNEIIGVGRLSKLPGTNEAEMAIVVSDEFQHQGLGTELLWRLVAIGRDEKLRRIVADILPENHEMQHLCQKVGFRLQWVTGEPVVKAWFDLQPNSGASQASS